jgi:TatD DNase family protein
MHCFTGDATDVERIVDAGLLVSVAGIVTFPKAAALRDAIARVPADRLLVETDAPYLAPTPYRGRRNEPAWVVRCVEVVAEASGRTVAEVAARTTENFEALFLRRAGAVSTESSAAGKPIERQ